MHQSSQFKDFYSFINAIDILDSVDNAIIVWADPDADEHQVTFTTFGKPRHAKMVLLENHKTTISFYDNHTSAKANEIEVRPGTHGDYKACAEYLIKFLKTGDL